MSELTQLLTEKVRTLIESVSYNDELKLRQLFWDKQGNVPPTIRHSSGNQPDVYSHESGAKIVGSFSRGHHAFTKHPNGKDWNYVGTAHASNGKFEIKGNKKITESADDEIRQLQNLYWEKHGPTHPSIRHSSGNQPSVGTHPDHPGMHIVSGTNHSHVFKKSTSGKGWDYVGTAHSVYKDDPNHPFGRSQVHGKIEIRKSK